VAFVHRLRELALGHGTGVDGLDDVQMCDLITRDPETARRLEFADPATRGIPWLNSHRRHLLVERGSRHPDLPGQ
jgi:hypothetical protein